MILYILNLFDLLSTLYALSLGLVEMNPIMDFCISIHPAFFALIKLIPAYWLCRWLQDKKSYPYIVGAFGATVWWNIVNIILIGGNT